LLVGQASRSQPRLPAPESSELRGSGRQITLARVYLCLFPGASGSRRKRTLAALCFCVFLCWAAPNALADYRFDNWTTDNGLPNNSVHDIVQTRDGYLWFATHDGLVRYDGVKFTVYDKGNSRGIASNRFERLFEDSSGRLWCALNFAGLTVYENGAFTTYTSENGLAGEVFGMGEDGAGNVLIKTAAGIFQQDGDHFIPYQQTSASAFPFKVPGQAGGGLSCMDDGGLHVFKDGRYVTYSVKEGLSGLDLAGLCDDNQGTVWVWTRSGKLNRIKDGAVTVFPLTQYSGTAMRATFQDSEGNVWIGVWGVGLVRLRDGTSTLYAVADGISSRTINTIFEDSERNIWLATEASGIYKIRKKSVSVLSQNDGLGGNNIEPVYQDSRGDVWIGGLDSGLNRVRNGAITRYTHAAGLPSNFITAISEDRDGYLWVGTFEGVVRFKEGRSPQFDRPPGLPMLMVYAIIQDGHGNMWLGGRNGLARYKDGAAVTYRTNAAGDNSESGAIVSILEDSDGYLWLGTLAGIVKFKDGAMRAYTDQDGLPCNHVRAIHQDKNGVLWFGTYDGGLVRLKDGKFTAITTSAGLFSNGAFQILEDDRDNFWVSSNQGIYRVARHELDEVADRKIAAVRCVSYGKSNGLLNPECNGGRQPAGCRTRDGRLWFPTQEGVAIIDPAAIPVNAARPPVRIETVAINHQPVTFGGTLYLYPGQDNLEIGFTAISFLDSDRMTFKYRLEGLDRDWTDSGTRRTAYLSRIPPGRYTFRVTAANSDGVWNDVGAAIKLVVVPPFYRTWWFITLVCLGVIGATALAYRRRIAGLRRAQRIQEAFSKQLIEYQETERKRIAAELHDGLSQSLVVIKNRAIMAQGEMGDLEAIGEQLDEIGSSVSQAIDEVREIAHNLRPVLLDRLGLTKALESMLRKVSASNRTQFTYEIAPLEGVFPKEAEVNLYRIVQETINNIIKHSKASEAAVKITRADGVLNLRVRDNGKGFDTEEAARTGGFGLIGITERARILGGEAAIRSSAGEGTVVEIRFKLKGAGNGR